MVILTPFIESSIAYAMDFGAIVRLTLRREAYGDTCS